ncbi:hypothetical protein H5410_002714 [Solanum commersonii]|uniref:Uncharacterized protein n=1 Tax=Solanum commersonii TaxID=4109 RepID=A0A9J6B2L6_SOLCO|nr:hypothetical protein H5410_002714 [Solanum commersonii]
MGSLIELLIRLESLNPQEKDTIAWNNSDGMVNIINAGYAHHISRIDSWQWKLIGEQSYPLKSSAVTGQLCM